MWSVSQHTHRTRFTNSATFACVQLFANAFVTVGTFERNYRRNLSSCTARSARGTSIRTKNLFSSTFNDLWLSFKFDPTCTYNLAVPTAGCKVNPAGRPFAINLVQVANLRCAQVNSASYPSRDGKWVVAYALRGEGLVWLIGAVVCLCAAPRVPFFASAGNGWPHKAPRYH